MLKGYEKIFHQKTNRLLKNYYFLAKILVEIIPLNRIEIAKANSDATYEFFCGKWLATDEDDGEIVRELPATGKSIKNPGTVKDYKITVKTGDTFGAGTDANVFLNIYGSMGDTGKRPLEKSQNRNKFERSNADEFTFQSVDLAEIDHIQIGRVSTRVPNPGTIQTN